MSNDTVELSVPGVVEISGDRETVEVNTTRSTLIDVTTGSTVEVSAPVIEVVDVYNPSLGTGDGRLANARNPLTSPLIPETARDLTASPGFTYVRLDWTGPVYFNHDHTEIWRATVNNRAASELLLTDQGTSAAVQGDPGVTYYFWIRHVSMADKTGNWSSPDLEGVSASTGDSAQRFVDALTGKFSEASFTSSMQNRLDGIEGNATAISTESTARIAAIADEKQARAAAIFTESTARTSADQAMAADITQLVAKVEDPATGVGATATALNTISTTVNAQGDTLISHSEKVASLENTVNNPVTGVNATSSAVTSLTSTVETQGSDAVLISERTTHLENKINHPATGMDAVTDATNYLTTRVELAEDSILAHASELTQLEGTVNDPVNGVAASASAIDNLETLTTVQGDNITSQATAITALESSVNHPSSGVAATSSAVDSLDSRVTSTEGGIESQSTKLTELKATVNSITIGFQETWEGDDPLSQWEAFSGGGEMSIIADNGLPVGTKALEVGNSNGNDEIWLAHRRLIPFDSQQVYRLRGTVSRLQGTGTIYLGYMGIAADGVTKVNIMGGDTYGSQHYHALAGFSPSDTGYVTSAGYTQGHSGTAQGSGTLADPYKMHTNVRYLRPLILVNYPDRNGQTRIGRISVELVDTQIKGNAGAITSLVSRVTASEGSITSQAEALTALQSDVTDNTNNVQGNADAVAGLSTRVTSAEGNITSQAEDITTLKTDVLNNATGITGNAEATSALTTRVTATENSITAQASDITALQADTGNNATAIAAETTARNALDVRVTAAENSITAQSSEITELQSGVGDLETGTAATASAVTALTTRVTSAENALTAQSSQATALSNTLNANLNKDQQWSDIQGTGKPESGADVTATSTAHTELSSRVTATEDTLTAQAADVTGLQSGLSVAKYQPVNKGVITDLADWASTVSGEPENVLPLDAACTLTDASGQTVLESTANTVMCSRKLYPVNTARTYKVRIRVRQMANNTSGGNHLYVGVVCLDKNKVYISEGIGSFRYCAAVNTAPQAADGWITYEGEISGIANNYNAFKNGTVYVRTVALLNYNGTGGTIQVEELTLEDVTDAKQRADLSATAVNALDTRVTATEDSLTAHSTELTRLETGLINGVSHTGILANPVFAIKRADGRPAGMYAAYGTDDKSIISYPNPGNNIVRIYSATDTSIGVAFAAFRIKPNTHYQVKVRAKASVSSGSGFYIGILARHAELLPGEKVITSQGKAEVPHADYDSFQWIPGNAAIQTGFTQYTGLYTPDADAQWGCLNILNWDGMGASSLYLEAVDVYEVVNTDSLGAATSSALNSLDSRVDITETDITAQASSITQLQTDLVNTKDAADANAGAISTLNNRVTSTEDTITSQSSQLTRLDNNISQGLTGGGLLSNPHMEVEAADGRPAGAMASYGGSNPAVISYLDGNKNVLKLHHATDLTTGLTFPPFRVKPGTRYRIVVRAKSNTVSTTGFYIGLFYLSSELPAGTKTISNGVGELPTAVADNTSWLRSNGPITTEYQTMTYDHVPPPGSVWGCLNILNWDGMGTSSLHIEYADVMEVVDTTSLGAATSSAVNSLTSRVDDQDGVLTSHAESLTELTTSVNGNTSSVTQHASSINGLSAQWSLKTNVNGYVAGIGLSSYSSGANGSESVLEIVADKFRVRAPGAANNLGFTIQGNNTVMDGAYIKDGTIDNAKIGNYIQSSNYLYQQTGWRIDKGGMINANGINIWQSGNLILSSGSGIESTAPINNGSANTLEDLSNLHTKLKIFEHVTSMGWPTSTDINGAGTLQFWSDYSGPGTLLIQAFDAEGAVHAGLNGTDLGIMTGPGNTLVWYEFDVTLQQSTNTLQYWSTSGDGGYIREVEVYAYSQQARQAKTASQAATEANWGNVNNDNGKRPADNATVGATWGNNVQGQPPLTQQLIVRDSEELFQFSENLSGSRGSGVKAGYSVFRENSGPFGSVIRLNKATTNLLVGWHSQLHGYLSGSADIAAESRPDGYYRISRKHPDGPDITEILTDQLCLSYAAGNNYTQSFKFRHDGTVCSFKISFFSPENGHQGIDPVIVNLGGGEYLAYASFTARTGDASLRPVDLIGLSGDWSYIEIKEAQLEARPYPTAYAPLGSARTDGKLVLNGLSGKITRNNWGALVWLRRDSLQGGTAMVLGDWTNFYFGASNGYLIFSWIDGDQKSFLSDGRVNDHEWHLAGFDVNSDRIRIFHNDTYYDYSANIYTGKAVPAGDITVGQVSQGSTTYPLNAAVSNLLIRKTGNFDPQRVKEIYNLKAPFVDNTSFADAPVPLSVSSTFV